MRTSILCNAIDAFGQPARGHLGNGQGCCAKKTPRRSHPPACGCLRLFLSSALLRSRCSPLFSGASSRPSGLCIPCERVALSSLRSPCRYCSPLSFYITLDQRLAHTLFW